MDERALVRLDSSPLKKVENKLAITNKIVTQATVPKVIKFLQNHPDFFIRLVSRYYPLNETLLEKYKNYWNWEDEISRNAAIEWNSDIIDKYFSEYEVTEYDYHTWWNLCGNDGIVWNMEMIDKYIDKIDDSSGLFWMELSGKSNIAWNATLLEKYAEKWEWGGSCGISANDSIPWTIELIKRFEDYIEFDWMSSNEGLPWSSYLIAMYSEKWEWGSNFIDPEDEPFESLCSNQAIYWTEEMIDRYVDKINFSHLSEVEKVPWNKVLIKKYAKKWSWNSLESILFKRKELNDELIEFLKEEYPGWYDLSTYIHNSSNYKHITSIDHSNWNWTFLSNRFDNNWDVNLLEIFRIFWDWDLLSANYNISWSVELVEKNESLMNWFLVAKNPNMPWTGEFIEKYSKKWQDSHLDKERDYVYEIQNIFEKHGMADNKIDMDKFDTIWLQLTKNTGVQFTTSIIRKFKEFLYFGKMGLSDKEELPWTIDLIAEFHESWDWDSLIKNKAIYRKAVKPYLNEKSIIEVMECIIKSKGISIEETNPSP